MMYEYIRNKVGVQFPKADIIYIDFSLRLLLRLSWKVLLRLQMRKQVMILLNEKRGPRSEGIPSTQIFPYFDNDDVRFDSSILG